MFGLAAYLTIWRRSKGYQSEKHRRAGGVVRVFAYALVVSLGLGLVTARKAQADSAESMMGLSQDLMALKDVLGDGRDLKINGETIHVMVGPSPDSVKGTLDRFQKHCEENPGVLAEAWSALDRAGSKVEIPLDVPDTADGRVGPDVKHGSVKMGTFRSGTDDEGIVVCLVRANNGAQTIKLALDEFAKTQDLGALGKMRYAYAKKAKTGTSLMTAWTDDHFSFKSLTPNAETGDAPGTDSVIVPRLPQSQRILTADVVGTSYAVRVYNAPGTVAQAEASYDTSMRRLGFTRIHTEHAGERGYLREGLLITMGIETTRSGVTVSVAELGSNVGTPAGGPVPTMN